MTDFRPVLYLKRSCPFCLKVASYLSEAQVLGDLEIRAFWPGDDEESGIRRELDGKVAKISFPTLQHAPGEYMTESDAIIAHYREQTGMEPERMAFFQYVQEGPVRRMREQFATIRELEQRVAGEQG